MKISYKFYMDIQRVLICPCIWLYLIIMSCTSFRVNPHSVVYLNVKQLLARSRRYIWSLNDSSESQTHNHLVRKRTFNHLGKLAKWLSCVLSSYLYGAFDCMLSSCHVIIMYVIIMFAYELSGCRFEFRCYHKNSRYGACFEQGIPWPSGKL